MFRTLLPSSSSRDFSFPFGCVLQGADGTPRRDSWGNPDFTPKKGVFVRGSQSVRLSEEFPLPGGARLSRLLNDFVPGILPISEAGIEHRKIAVPEAFQ